MGTEDKLYNKIKHAAENAEQKDFPGMDKVWARVEEKLDTNVAKKETSNWKKIAVAASVVLLTTIGYQFYTNTETVETPVIVNETKIDPLESNEVLVETQENQIISTEEAGVILNNQINKPNNEAVKISEATEKKTTVYPEEINILNDDEIVTYVRAYEKDKIVVKEEIELIPFGKEQEEKLTQSGFYNTANSNAINFSPKSIMKTNFDANAVVNNDAKIAPSKKTDPLVVVDGDYYCALGEEEAHFIEYKLTLNLDGTFVFHSYSNNKQGIPNEVNKYGKGKWIVKDKIITFLSNKEKDFDEKYTLDFNNSKARFENKHPRDKTDRIVKTKMVFLESEIFWMKRIEMFKM